MRPQIEVVVFTTVRTIVWSVMTCKWLHINDSDFIYMYHILQSLVSSPSQRRSQKVSWNSPVQFALTCLLMMWNTMDDGSFLHFLNHLLDTKTHLHKKQCRWNSLPFFHKITHVHMCDDIASVLGNFLNHILIYLYRSQSFQTHEYQLSGKTEKRLCTQFRNYLWLLMLIWYR